MPCPVIVCAQPSMVSPSTSLAPFQCCSRLPQQPFNRVVLARIGRVVQPLDGFAEVIGAVHPTREELSPHSPAFQPILYLQLPVGEGSSLGYRGIVPPGRETSAMKALVLLALPKVRWSGPLSSSTSPQGTYLASPPLSGAAAR